MSNQQDINNIFQNKCLLIMDFDGTIADTYELHKEAYEITLKDYGISFNYVDYAGQKTSYALNTAFKKANYPIEKSEINKLAYLKQFKVRELIANSEEFSTLPGVEPFIGWAQSRFKLVIASSGSRGTVEISLKKLGLDHIFEHVLCSEDVTESKPSPEIFLKSLSLTDFSKQESLIFEDSDSGIKAAKLACIPFIDVRKLTFITLNKYLEI